MSEASFDQLVYSKNVIEFVTVANEYCAFVENHARLNRVEFIEKAQKIFPLLYLKASLLPAIDNDGLETPEKFVTEVDYSFLLNRISEKLAQYDSYLEVFDAKLQFSEGAIEASIAENVCDIYQDLKDFLMAFRIGTSEIMADALWECNNNFKNYWGQKLVNGLRALHQLLYGEEELDDDQPELFGADDEIEETKNSDVSWVSKHFDSYSDED
jgi:hypothetical protein